MTREQIEKAAMEYAEKIPQSDERREYSREDFIAGAQWRINSVWHDDISECRDVKRWIVVEYNNGYVDVLHDIRGLDGVKDLVVRVAYLDDLLPEKKEGWVNIDKGGSGKITISSPYSTKEEAIHNDNETTIDTIKISWEE